MATMRIEGNEMHVRFAVWERLFVWRAGLRVPLSAVRGVERVDRALRRTRGGRVGLLVSGVIKVGRWGIGSGVRQLVAVRRGVPALWLTLDRAVTGFDEVLISVHDADRLVEVLRA